MEGFGSVGAENVRVAVGGGGLGVGGVGLGVGGVGRGLEKPHLKFVTVAFPVILAIAEALYK